MTDEARLPLSLVQNRRPNRGAVSQTARSLIPDQPAMALVSPVQENQPNAEAIKKHRSSEAQSPWEPVRYFEPARGRA
jgi:hypothetical protein